MASDLNDAYPSFRGGSGSECEEFISSVRKAAFNVGKVNDDGWQAGYASACLSGAALRFYEDLPENTQTSWKLLRAALLSKYPDAPKDPLASAVPDAPPASAPSPPAHGTQNSLKTLTALARWGYEPTEPGDLSLRVGDKINWVYTKHEGVPDDWWLGKNERTGSWGTFPSTWVYVVQETLTA